MMTQPRRLLACFLALVVASGIFGTIPTAHAAVSIDSEYTAIRENGIIFANICNGSADVTTSCTQCRNFGQCTVQNVLQVLVNVSYLILALSGTAALFAFVYGGLEWVTSAGHPDRVKNGKMALTSAIIGLVIIFGAYTAINLLISVLRNGEPATGSIENSIDKNAPSTTTRASDIIQTSP